MPETNELSYSPEDFDAIEGLAQDTLARGNPMGAATRVHIFQSSDEPVVIKGQDLDFWKRCDPHNIIKMVVVVRRLRYLFERVNAQAQAIAQQLQALAQTAKTSDKSWGEERVRLREALDNMAGDTGKAVADYLFEEAAESEEDSTDSVSATATSWPSELDGPDTTTPGTTTDEN